MQLYQVDVRKSDDDAGSDREKQKGLKSPYGRRGAICSHFGWTWEYLHHGIAWSVVQRMLIDAPSYDFDHEKKKEKDETILSRENAERIANHINNLV